MYYSVIVEDHVDCAGIEVIDVVPTMSATRIPNESRRWKVERQGTKTALS